MTPLKPSIYDMVALSGLVQLLAAATATESLWITAYACVILGPRTAWVLWAMLQTPGHDVVLSDRLRVLALPFRFGFWGVMCTHGYAVICTVLMSAELVAWAKVSG